MYKIPAIEYLSSRVRYETDGNDLLNTHLNEILDNIIVYVVWRRLGWRFLGMENAVNAETVIKNIKKNALNI